MRLLLIAPAKSYRVGDFLDAATSVGCAVTVACDEPSAISDSTVCVPFGDPLRAAKELVGRVGEIDGVVGTDGGAVAVAAEVARLLGLSANERDAVVAAGDKLLQRQAAARVGVPQPDFAAVEEADIADWLVFPAVVKPRRRAASQGVVRVDTPRGLREAVRRVYEIVGDGEGLLVERFVPGVEVAVEGLLRDGRLEVLAVFDKPDTPEGPSFPETLLISPARLNADALRGVVGVAARACAAVGLLEGPVHVECKVDGPDVWFLELAARSIGGLCSRALTHGGASLEELIVRHALGLPVPSASRVVRGATGVLMLPVERTGRLVAVRGMDAAGAVEGVTDVVLSVGPGQAVVALPEGDRYLGFVFARAASADAVEAALREAWARLDVVITAS